MSESECDWLKNLEREAANECSPLSVGRAYELADNDIARWAWSVIWEWTGGDQKISPKVCLNPSVILWRKGNSMNIETIRKLLGVIEANPARFSDDVLEKAASMSKKIDKTRDYLVVRGREVLCEVKTTALGARRLAIDTQLSVVPKDAISGGRDAFNG